MAKKATTKTLDERGVEALESISNSMVSIESFFLDIIDAEWSSKLEWYLHEFLQLSKGNVQGSHDRPDRDSERQKVK